MNDNFNQHTQLINAIRKDIIGELDAIIQYSEHIEEFKNESARKVWEDIKNEERVHVGELFTLLINLEPSELEYFNKGEYEVKKILNL